MAQHDFVINNQGFPAFRQDLNDFLNAVRTTHSGTTRPSGAVSGTIWLDTTSSSAPTLKYYDGTDDISLATIDHTANTVNWLDSTVSITGLSTTATGTVLTLSDTATTSTVNLIIDNQKEVRFRETTGNGTNYIGLKAPASVSADLTFTLPTAPTSNNQALISSTAGVMSFTPYSFPSADGSANQVLQTNGSGALSFATASGGGGGMFKNIVINGDMQIARRNTSVASITTSNYYTLDRWKLLNSSLGTFTMSQSTDVPSGYGFANSLKLDNTTADATPSASDYLAIIQSFEGQNLQYLKKGTANAVSLTASFWVKSTKTGTFICELEAGTRSISKSYTVSASNTWEFKTITFAGDTSGTITNNNASGMTFYFWLGVGTDFSSGTLATSWGTQTNANRAVGQVNIADSTSNDFLITGVQLEAGTSATDFEFLPYDINDYRCKRYYQKTETGIYKHVGNWQGIAWSGTAHTGSIATDVQMRTNPTLSYAGTWQVYGGGGVGGGYTPSGSNIDSGGYMSVAMSGTSRASSQVLGAYADDASCYIAWDAEL